jgi:hypothetical protein
VSRDKSVKRFAQDDDFVGVLEKNTPSKLALMGLRPTQGDEERLGPATTLYRTVAFPLSSRGADLPVAS